MRNLDWIRRVANCAVAVVTLATMAGCPSTRKPEAVNGVLHSKKARPLVLLVADDPQLGQAIAREWLGRTEEELTVRYVSLAELAAASRLPGDAVIFPSGWLGQLAERELIVPLDSEALEDPDFNHRDIFDHVRMREMRWGGRTMAAPLGSPQLLLCYRTDVFTKLEIEPPRNWDEYQAAVERLADQTTLGDLAPAEGKPWRATIEPLADGWAGQLLLARAASYALHREQVSPLFRFDTMEPLVDEPPFVRALEELVLAAKERATVQDRMTPQEAFASLCRGECGMAIGWPSGQLSDAGPYSAKVGIAPLPGAGVAYRAATKAWEARGEDESGHVPLLAVSGRMAAVTSSAADAKRAAGFVLWLSGREISAQLAPHSSATTLFRSSQIGASGRWTPALTPEASRQYAETVSSALTGPRVFQGLNLPGRPEYLAALDEAVRRGLDGQSPKESLAVAAEAWATITEKLGVEKQRRANRRSLGLEKF